MSNHVHRWAVPYGKGWSGKDKSMITQKMYLNLEENEKIADHENELRFQWLDQQEEFKGLGVFFKNAWTQIAMEKERYKSRVPYCKEYDYDNSMDTKERKYRTILLGGGILYVALSKTKIHIFFIRDGKYWMFPQEKKDGGVVYYLAKVKSSKTGVKEEEVSKGKESVKEEEVSKGKESVKEEEVSKRKSNPTFVALYKVKKREVDKVEEGQGQASEVILNELTEFAWVSKADCSVLRLALLDFLVFGGTGRVTISSLALFFYVPYDAFNLFIRGGGKYGQVLNNVKEYFQIEIL